MTEAAPFIAVTGAGGFLGAEISRQLDAARIPHLRISRSPWALRDQLRGDPRGPARYDATSAMEYALRGAHTLVLISAWLSGRRFEEHASAIDAAISAGVERIIYVSLMGAGPTAVFRNARDHWMTEQYLASVGVRHTIVRPSFYASTLVDLADAGHVIAGPAGGGKTAFITHSDVALTIVGLAVRSDLRDDAAIYEVTGPEALGVADAVHQLRLATGRPLTFRDLTVEESFGRLVQQGLRGDEIDSRMSWFRAIDSGALDHVTEAVRDITGSTATPLRGYRPPVSGRREPAQ